MYPVCGDHVLFAVIKTCDLSKVTYIRFKEGKKRKEKKTLKLLEKLFRFQTNEIVGKA